MAFARARRELGLEIPLVLAVPDYGVPATGYHPPLPALRSDALIVMEEEEAKRRGLVPLARITGYATGGGDPKMLFYAPVVAVKKLLALTGKPLEHYDLIEANEAFAVQALADGKELAWDWNRVNVNGGAVALGHPIGASGARVLVTLIHALKDRGKRKGIATLCIGGGEAVALGVELV